MKPRRKGRPLQCTQQQKEVIRLWAEGYSYPAICDYLKEHHKIETTPQNIRQTYVEGPKWADERRRAVAKADAELDNCPMSRRSARQKRREDLYQDEAKTVEEKRRILADAASDAPKGQQEGPAPQVTINVLAVLEALTGSELAAARAKIEQRIGQLEGNTEGDTDPSGTE